MNEETPPYRLGREEQTITKQTLYAARGAVTQNENALDAKVVKEFVVCKG